MDPQPTVSPSPLDTATLMTRLAAEFPDADVARARIARAPGRVNLIGEHTDYNDGLVMPVAIDREIRIAFAQTSDRRVEVALAETGEHAGFDLDAIPARRGAWIDYIAGVARVLIDASVPVRGFRGILASDLPQGSGLSSSAALELATAWCLLDPDVAPPDAMTLARLGQRAENTYVGVNCGLMDQFASAHGRRDGALLLDCRSLEWRPVAVPLDRVALIVCDTSSPHRLGSSAYNERRAQCERAVAVMSAAGAPVRALRDVDHELLESFRDRLDPLTFARCQHVVDEDARVLEAEAAFGRDDLDAVGRLFAASHASLRDLYNVSSPELDALVEIAMSVPGVVAARMTGAGFGGCTVNLVRRDAIAGLAEAVVARYPERTGLQPKVYAVEPALGAGLMPA
jgi:galactokinase